MYPLSKVTPVRRRGRSAALAVGVLVLCLGFVAVPATAENVTATDSNVTVDESVVETDAPDPASDRLGWESGVWANATLSIDQSDGITESELEAVVARTMARIESIRGIEFDRTPPVRILFADEQESAVAEGQFETEPSGEAERALLNAQYEALLLINESSDAVESRQALTGAVNGYYRPETGNVTMVSPTGDVRQIREAILAQELFHAQQDTQFDIPDVETIEERNTRNSYIEGDANYVQELYEQHCESTWSGTCYRPDRTSVPDLSALDEGMQRLFTQPYESGQRFVSNRHEQMGWAAVDSLYENPPASTEQVIHPDRYGEDDPSDLGVRDRSTDAWQPLTADGERLTGSVGEPGLYVSLLSPALDRSAGGEIIPIGNHRSGGRSLSYDHPATTGWDGDRLLPYVATASNETGYVYEIAWDTTADAREFHDAYRRLLAYHGADPVADLPNTYRLPERSGFADAFHVDRNGTRLRIVNAPTVDALAGVDREVTGSDTAESVPWERSDVTWAAEFDETPAGTTLADGRAYVQSGSGTLFALDGATGEQVWRADLGNRTSVLRASSGTVYVGTSGSNVVAVDAATGDTTWRTPVGGSLVTLLTVAGDAVLAGTPTGTVDALDAATGEREVSGVVEQATAQPTVTNGTLFAGTRSGLVAVDTATGNRTWGVELDGVVLSSPTVSAGTVYVPTVDTAASAGQVHAVDAATGDVVWTHETASINRLSVTVANETAYVKSVDTAPGNPSRTPTGVLTALTAGSGEQRWTLELNGSLDVAPVVANGSLYVGGAEGTVHAVAATSGERRWSTATAGGVNSPLVLTDGTLYAGDEGGVLSALDPVTGDTRWSFVADGLAGLSPAVDGGTVYADGQTTLYAVDGTTPGDDDGDGNDDSDDDGDGNDDSDDDGDGNDDSDDDGDDDSGGDDDGNDDSDDDGNDDSDDDGNDDSDGNGNDDSDDGGNDDNDNSGSDDSPDDTDSDGGNGSGADGNGPGFGVLVVVLAVVAVVFTRRR